MDDSGKCLRRGDAAVSVALTRKFLPPAAGGPPFPRAFSRTSRSLSIEVEGVATREQAHRFIDRAFDAYERDVLLEEAAGPSFRADAITYRFRAEPDLTPPEPRITVTSVVE